MSERLTGTVKWFDAKKGFGFINGINGGKDIFIHFSAIDGTGFKTLNDGDTVSFVIVDGKKGPEAKEVNIADGNA
jgi:CspA family cold shock protein